VSDGEEGFSECVPLNGTIKVIPPEHEFLAVFCDHATDATLKSRMVQVLAHAPLKPRVGGSSEEEGQSPSGSTF